MTDQELPSGKHLVCPRCGEAASEDPVWCEACGLNLRRAGELPTADAYAARIREQRWLERQTNEEREAGDEGHTESATLERNWAEEDATTPIRSRESSPGPRRRRFFVGLGVFAALAALAGGTVLVVAGSSKEGKTSVTETTTPSPPPQTSPSSAPVSPSSTPASLAPASYVPYSPTDPHYAYTASIPSGNGWNSPIESTPTSGDLLRTTVRGPENSILVIDRTPHDVPQLGGGYDSKRTVSQPAFGSATEYIFLSSKSIPECTGTACVDYLIDDGQGGGWGILGGGPSLALASEVAAQVAESIAP
jgi:hypothetical protein